MSTFRTNYKCHECSKRRSSRTALTKMKCSDGKMHFVCMDCWKKMTASDENITIEPRVQEVQIAPFQPDDVVKFIPMYAEEYTSKGKHYGIALNCINYGSEEKPSWSIDVQFLKELDGVLQLSPVKAYMIASWQVEKSDRQWERGQCRKSRFTRQENYGLY